VLAGGGGGKEVRALPFLKSNFNGSSGCFGVLEFIFENFLFKQKFSGRHREMRARARVRWQRKDLLN